LERFIECGGEGRAVKKAYCAPKAKNMKSKTAIFAIFYIIIKVKKIKKGGED
jgi:hypothetical protein